MAIPTLKQLFDLARTNAEALFRMEGKVPPIWHAVSEDGDEHLICTPWCSDDEKNEAIAALVELFQKKRIVRFAFVCEAWTVSSRTAATLSIPPSQNPDRREVLRIATEDRSGETLSGHFYILRPEHGPPTLSPFHMEDQDVMASGRMVGLLWRDETKTKH